jgi:hypothetical protein
MAFDETFRPNPKFDEVEVFRLTGRAEEVRELGPSNFDGPVAEWAAQRMEGLGETIVPRHVYTDYSDTPEGHKVAWVYHDGIDMETGSTFCLHHVACDCYLKAENLSGEEKEFVLGECESLKRVLEKRAVLVNATYGVANVIDRMYDHERLAPEQSDETQAFVQGSLLYMLEHDYRHPESWVANVESGWNLIRLLARVMEIRYEDAKWFAADLAEKEMVETDGVVVLLDSKRRAEIDAERLLRGLAA